MMVTERYEMQLKQPHSLQFGEDEERNQDEAMRPLDLTLKNIKNE